MLDKKWINLNVGGTLFMSNRSTLTRGTPPNSPLHRISTNSTNVIFDRDEKGAYIIDRDPQYFQVILNYLRTRKLIIPPNVAEEAILLEAEFFNIPELVRLTRSQLAQRDQNVIEVASQNQFLPNRHNQMIDQVRPTMIANGSGTIKPPTMDAATLAKLATELKMFTDKNL